MFADIEKITFGAERICKEGKYHSPLRFTVDEQSCYLNEPDNYKKTFASAGIRLCFETDADGLSFGYRLLKASSRNMAYFDVYVNGSLLCSEGEITDSDELCKSFCLSLPGGEKSVCIYMPNLFQMQICDFDLKGATFVKPHKYERKLVAYGDSITQGYDAVYPSHSYVNLFADKLNAEVINKAIGGDMFRPTLLNFACRTPDIVTVAYGTNDWSHGSKKDFTENVPAFFDKTDTAYKNSEIIVITPIWRADNEKITDCGSFSDAFRFIKTEAQRHKRFKIIDGRELISHDPSLFPDGYLHPGDTGMKEYADRLYEKLK